ncbi:hypothetical protein LCGC14_0428210 [marine sediment metagenome]|uniref:Uncharacterized protein n=1 Tax=marine sediment metagenome TaxID=412755 RepID=A0A0F9VAS8_9ZZZZ
MNEKSQNQSLFSNQQLKELSKPSLLTLLKYVDSMFKEKEGEIPTPPDVGLTPFQRQVMLAREIELLIERDGEARVSTALLYDVFSGPWIDRSIHLLDVIFEDNNWTMRGSITEAIVTITPGKEGERWTLTTPASR